MQNRWIALLRAVNLGGRNKVPMAELRELFERAGAESVRTYIQSGNVVFTQKAPDGATLEAAVAKAFGVDAIVILRTARQMARLADDHPFGKDTSKSHVAFLAERPTRAALAAVRKLDAGADRFEFLGADIALHYPKGFQGARLTVARLEKALGVAATARNWRTVAKLAELAAEG